jgi:hypothetical protein
VAIKVYEGFDHYNGPRTDMLQRLDNPLQWQLYGSANTPTLSFVTGMDGKGLALSISGVGGFVGPNAGLPTQWPVAVFKYRTDGHAFIGVRCNSPGVNQGFVLFFYDTLTISPTVQFSIFFNPSNYSIQVYKGAFGTLEAFSENNVWAPNMFNFLEAWPVVANGTGSINIRVNGELILTAASLNLQSSANASWDAIGFDPILTTGVAGFTATFVIDDLYYCDDTVGPGSYPCNAFLGDMHTYTQFTIGNNTLQWSPLAGTNWMEVHEIAMDSDLSYNFSSTVGQEDLLNFQALEATISKIIALQITGAYRKDDAGMRVVKQAVKSNTTEVYGSNWSLPDNDYGYFTDLFVLDPDIAGSWTLTPANAISAGYNVAA